MIEFYLVAAALVLLAGMFVVFPIMMRHGDSSTRKATNVEAFRERRRELDSELEQGVIERDEYERLLVELERRLLEDAAEDSAGKQLQRPSLAVVLGMLAFVAVVAGAFYYYTGYGPDWQLTQNLRAAQKKAASGADVTLERAQLLAEINSRLQLRPEQPFYLLLKANLEMESGQYPLAITTLDKLMEVDPNDPVVMSQAVEARFLKGGRKLDVQARSLAQQVLAIDPRNARTLGLLGIASFEAEQYADAIRYWRQLLPLVGPFSPNGKMISQGIERAKTLLAKQGGEMPAAPQAARLEVNVALGDSIKADKSASVFVYARAAKGPRMPLAVKRLTVADLPAHIVLDDSMAMAPGMNLSSFKEVEVVARISKRGIANRGSGDIEGSKGPIRVADAKQPIAIVIDQVLP